jgi:hypothetical protein
MPAKKIKAQSTKHQVQSSKTQDQRLKPQGFQMYRRPRFLEVLHAIREEMSREADYDVDLFAEMVRSGVRPMHGPERVIRGFKTRAPRADNNTRKPGKRRQQKRAAQ